MAKMNERSLVPLSGCIMEASEMGSNISLAQEVIRRMKNTSKRVLHTTRCPILNYLVVALKGYNRMVEEEKADILVLTSRPRFK